jgi:hypothetical protein
VTLEVEEGEKELRLDKRRHSSGNRVIMVQLLEVGQEPREEILP